MMVVVQIFMNSPFIFNQVHVPCSNNFAISHIYIVIQHVFLRGRKHLGILAFLRSHMNFCMPQKGNCLSLKSIQESTSVATYMQEVCSCTPINFQGTISYTVCMTMQFFHIAPGMLADTYTCILNNHYMLLYACMYIYVHVCIYYSYHYTPMFMLVGKSSTRCIPGCLSQEMP